MRRKLFSVLTLSAVLAVLLCAPDLVSGQDMPDRLEITAVDSSRFPDMTFYIDAFDADGRRHAGLFAFSQTLRFYEDGAEVYDGIYDVPRGTALTFLIDADSVVSSHWNEVRDAILDYADPLASWMDEDWDYVTLIAANGQDADVLVDQTQFHNAISNAFVLETGAPYQPPVAMTTPLADMIEETLTGWTAPTPTPGMYRALIVFSSGIVGDSTQSVEGAAALARERGIPIFAVQVGQEAGGEQALQQLVHNTHGGFYRLSADTTLDSLWDLLSSHRTQYAVDYRSKIVSSGSHAVKVQLSEVTSDFRFEITILSPEVEVSLPQQNQVIQRKPATAGDPSSSYEPTTEPVKYVVTWPDEHERDLTMVQLRVNGVVQQQLDLTTSANRNLVWDLTDLTPGPYSLRVEVEDELGLTGASREIPVTVEFVTPALASPTPFVATATPGPSTMAKVWTTARQNLRCISLSGLSLGALITLLLSYRRGFSLLKSSPVAFLRRQPFFRPFDSLLMNIERVAGPLRIKRPKITSIKRDGAPKAFVEVINGQSAAPGPFEVAGETAFGRSSERAQIVFAERTVSRFHARIVPEHGDKYRIYNHSGQNTWVNEQRVPDYGLLLQDGDIIRMGQVRLRFHSKKR